MMNKLLVVNFLLIAAAIHGLAIQAEYDGTNQDKSGVENAPIVFSSTEKPFAESQFSEGGFSPAINNLIPPSEGQSPIVFPITSTDDPKKETVDSDVKFGFKKKPRILIPPVHSSRVPAVPPRGPLAHEHRHHLLHNEPVPLPQKPIIPIVPAVAEQPIPVTPGIHKPSISEHVPIIPEPHLPVIPEQPVPVIPEKHIPVIPEIPLIQKKPVITEHEIPVIPKEKPVISEHLPIIPTELPLKPKHHLQIPKLHIPKLEITKLKIPKLHAAKEHIPRAPIVHHNAAPVVHEESHVPEVQIPKLHLPKLNLPKVHLPELHLPELHLPKLHLPKVHSPVIPSESHSVVPEVHESPQEEHHINPLPLNPANKLKSRLRGLLGKSSQ